MPGSQNKEEGLKTGAIHKKTGGETTDHMEKKDKIAKGQSGEPICEKTGKRGNLKKQSGCACSR